MSDFIIDESNLLSFVDEYTLFCHYLEFEPEIRCNYLSPLRGDDETPSFGIFPSRKFEREYFWKDSGGRGDSGDIYKLVRLLYGYQYNWEAVAKIKSDFNLGAPVEAREKIVRVAASHRSNADYRVRSKAFQPEDLQFWNQFNIGQSTLEYYRTSPLYCYWLTSKSRTPLFPRQSYVYRIYDRYQLYFPFNEKGSKFRNDLEESYVMGMQQLKFQSDTLVITKSYKDVMCLYSYGYEAVSPRSENTPMPNQFFDWANTHYKRVLVLFDNDMKHRGEWYPYNKIYVPDDTGCKDISDFTRDYSPQAAAELLRQITV